MQIQTPKMVFIDGTRIDDRETILLLNHHVARESLPEKDERCTPNLSKDIQQQEQDYHVAYMDIERHNLVDRIHGADKTALNNRSM